MPQCPEMPQTPGQYSELAEPYPPSQAPKAPSIRSDYELAQWFIQLCQDELGAPPVYTEGSFWFWAANHWRPETDLDVQKRIFRLNTISGVRINSTCMKKIFDSLKVLTTDESYFQQAQPTVAFADVTLRFSRSKDKSHVAVLALQHAPELQCRYAFAYSFEPLAFPQRFCSYLYELFAPDPDKAAKVELIREYIGACLFGIATQFEKVLLLYGPMGSNGKSRLIDVISALFATGAASVMPADFSDEYRLAQLAGARINLVGEVPQKQIQDATTLKQVISGDVLTARHIYGKPFRFQPRAGHIFALNKLPVVDDAGEAFWRRFVMLQFNRQFLNATLQADLIRPLVAEAAQIASWAIEGARELVQRGTFAVPPSSDAALYAWKNKADITLAFVTEATNEGGSTRVGATYQAFRAWCLKSGHRQIPSLPVFTERMKGCGFQSVRGKQGKHYKLTLKEQAQWEPAADRVLEAVK